MAFKRSLILGFSLIFIAVFAYGQQDTFQELPEFNLRYGSFRKNSSTFTWQVDSSTLSRFKTLSLAQLLQQESGIFIKNYSPGSLATSSLRGGSAQHTATLWNGFQITSPMLGQIDFSLLPVGIFQQIQVEHGEGSALWGSGAVAGTIHLNNQARFNQGISLSIGGSGGSFNTNNQNIGINYSDSNYALQFDCYRQFSENNFLFQDPFSSSERRMNHAKFNVLGTMLNQSFKWRKSILSLRIWSQLANREIPPTLMESTAEATQKDQAHRFALEHFYQNKKWKSNSRLGFFTENLDFRQHHNANSSLSQTQSLLSETDWKFKLLKNLELQFGAHSTLAFAESNGYENLKSQLRFAVFYGISHQFKHWWQQQFFVRKEWVDNIHVPLTYSYGSTFQIHKHLSIKANAAYLFRVPTLNDRFWSPGGNPDLKPEKGHSIDFGLYYQLKENKTWSQKLSVCVYHRRLHDWIIWLPQQTYWSPQNLMQVWSRGLEINQFSAFRKGNWYYALQSNLSLSYSTNEKAKMENDASLHKQLIYTPVLQYNIGFTLAWKSLEFYWQQGFVGERFISTDNTHSLPAFHLSNFRTTWKSKLKNQPFHLFIQVNNLFNNSYQVMAMRPMPLRHFQIGGQFNLQLIKNQNKTT